MTRALVALATVIFLAATGCSGSGPELTANDELRASFDASNEASFAFEDSIGECMRALGFEYESRINARMDFAAGQGTAVSLFPVFLDNFEDWPTDGYGFLDLLLPSLFITQEYDTVSVEDGFDEYDFALWGDPTDAADGGCAAIAADLHPEIGVAEEVWVDKYESDGDLAEELTGSALYLEWLGCMRSEGFDFVSLAGPSDFILNAALATFDPETEAFDPAKPVLELRFDEVSGRFVDDNYQEELDELRELERTVAAADHGCSQELYPVAQELLLRQ